MNETFLLVVVLLLLQVKHLVVDFHMQTQAMVDGKGLYGNITGILHSFQHVVGTYLVLAFVVVFLGLPLSMVMGLLLAALDGVVHYHVDWMKMNWGERDIREKKFWTHLGLDQMAHQIGYVVIALAAVTL